MISTSHFPENSSAKNKQAYIHQNLSNVKSGHHCVQSWVANGQASLGITDRAHSCLLQKLVTNFKYLEILDIVLDLKMFIIHIID
jgi:hypothetical protein